MSSISGQCGNRGQVNYSASKAGLIGAAKALSQEVAKRKITVNCIAPGIIETDMTEELPEEAAPSEVPEPEETPVTAPTVEVVQPEEKSPLPAWFEEVWRQLFPADAPASSEPEAASSEETLPASEAVLPPEEAEAESETEGAAE